MTSINTPCPVEPFGLCSSPECIAGGCHKWSASNPVQRTRASPSLWYKAYIVALRKVQSFFGIRPPWAQHNPDYLERLHGRRGFWCGVLTSAALCAAYWVLR
jgi:hypothetical protein